MAEIRRGTLVRVLGGFYTAVDPAGQEYTLRCKKKFRRMGLHPLPGDEIMFSPGVGEEHGWVEEVLPRKTVSLRPPVANVERMVLVESPVPEPDLLLADRQLARAMSQGMSAMIAVNKSDLDGGALAEELWAEYRPAGIPVIAVSAATGLGLQELRGQMEGALCCLSGQSGVGKSSLLNRMLGLALETGDISERIARGKNTTRHVELLRSGGLRVMDTAGFSLLEPERDLMPERLRERWPEFLPYEGKCRFNECLHDREPGCAVAEAAETGMIHPARLERYRTLLSETRENWKERYS